MLIARTTDVLEGSGCPNKVPIAWADRNQTVSKVMGKSLEVAWLRILCQNSCRRGLIGRDPHDSAAKRLPFQTFLGDPCQPTLLSLSARVINVVHCSSGDSGDSGEVWPAEAQLKYNAPTISWETAFWTPYRLRNYKSRRPFDLCRLAHSRVQRRWSASQAQGRDRAMDGGANSPPFDGTLPTRCVVRPETTVSRGP